MTYYSRFYSINTSIKSAYAAIVLAALQPLLVAQTARNCVPSPNGLVGWWAAEGDASDRTGLNPGTAQGGVTFEPGEVGKAFAMHGGLDAVKIGASASLDVGSGSGMTIETWISPKDLSRRSPLVEWNREGTSSAEWGAQLWVLQPGDFGLSAGALFVNLAEASGTGHYIYSPGGTVVTDVWQHVAVTYDKSSGQTRLYHNGRIVAQDNLGIFKPATSYNLFLGRRPAGDSAMSYVGLLDEVSIYNRVLAQTEIQDIYNSGGSGKCQPDNPGNHPPSISAIPNQTITEGTSTGPIGFTVNDVETAPDSLVVTGSSSNPTLVPDANIALGGSGNNRTVNVTPATNQTGSATITLTVSDGQARSSTSFTVMVQPGGSHNGAPTIGAIPDQVVIEDQPTDAYQLVLSDAETPELNLRLSGASSDPTVVPLENIFFGTAAGHWFITVTPAFGRSSGTTTITVTVSDGTNNASTQFTLRVNPPPPGAARFVNSSPITIPSLGAATSYPSQIDVTRMQGTITNVTLVLSKFSHNRVQDVSMLLVAPTGQGVVIFSHVSGGNRNAADVTVFLTDSSLYPLPSDFAVWSEPLKPAAYPPAPSFPAPAPSGPYGPVAFSTFNGLNANGTWSLYVYDDTDGGSGVITGGWRLIVATDGGGSSAPTISDIPDQSAPENSSTGPISFTIGDAETPASDLVLRGTSSNPALVPDANIVFGGSGSSRTVTVTPAANQTGTAIITVTVSDGALSASDNFKVIVNGGGSAPTISDIPDQSAPENGSTGPISFIIGDAETPASDLVLRGASSNPALVPDANIVFGGSGSSRTVTVTPAANQTGTAIITVTVSDGALSASDNFKVTVNGAGVLTVTVDNATRIYGAANPMFTGSLTGLQGGDNITATYTTTATPASPIGNYAITPVFSDPDSKLSKYTVVTNVGTLTINPAILIGKADDKSRPYGQPNPVFTVRYSGFVNGEDEGILTGTLVGFSPADPSSPSGTYPIAVSGQSAPNYTIDYQEGILTVTKVELVIQIDNATRTYGAANPALTGTITGIQNRDNIRASYTTAATPASSIGNYAITPVLSDPEGKLRNYKLVVHNGTLMVTPAALSVRADDKVRAFLADNPPLTGSIIGVQNGDNITAEYTTTATRTSLPGNYPITAALRDPNNRLGNYRVSIRNGTLTVTLLPQGNVPPLPVLDVSADDKTRCYGAANPALTGTITGLQDGDNITAIYSTEAMPGSPAGIYAITVRLVDPDNKLGHYAVSTHNGTLTVKLPGEVRLASLSYVNKHAFITGSGDPNVIYTIQESSDLIHWTNVGTAVADASGKFGFDRDGASNTGLRCFRAFLP